MCGVVAGWWCHEGNLLSETGDRVEVALSVANLSFDFRRTVDGVGPATSRHTENSDFIKLINILI